MAITADWVGATLVLVIEDGADDDDDTNHNGDDDVERDQLVAGAA